MSVSLVLLAAVCLALSGLPALLMGARSTAGAIGSTALNMLASTIGAAALMMYAHSPETGATQSWQWAIPLGSFTLGLDPLSLIFLIPILLISALGSIYGLSYWAPAHHPCNGQKLRICWGLLAASMILIVLARNAVTFLMAWEIMALSAYMLVATEDHKPEVRQAAWVYLVATHIGTLCLFGFFALLHSNTGSFDLWNLLDPASNPPLTAMLILALIGFGMKAGLFPLHVWLPGAHANAPSHVSALLSGVMLKMGVYGLFRVSGLIAHPPAWWGAVFLSVGSLSALLGIAYAVGQQDFKRLLAYSSIENIGIITMGLGLGLLGQSAGRPEWVALGIGASLFHVLNHSLFKPLLFLGAGNLLHAVHTRRMDRLGGLARQMPLTFIIFVLGSIAICGLPPLNGFVSELLLYLGLLQTAQTPAGSGAGGGGGAWAWAALAVPVLAAVGEMAIGGFVKLLGSVFQGTAHNELPDDAHDPGFTMALPLVLLAALCLMIGIFPMLLLPILEPAIRAWDAHHAPVNLASLAPWPWQTWAAATLLGGIAALTFALLTSLRPRHARRAGTWDCGYARPSARMQYTGASFAQMLVDLFAWALWPRGIRLKLKQLFPDPKTFSREVPDAVLDRVLLPTSSAGRNTVMLFRGLQQGSVQAYLVYLLVIIVLLVLVG